MKIETHIVYKNGAFEIERNCKYCGSLGMALSEGKGPHSIGLKCKGCERHNGWLSGPYSLIIKQIYEDGAPDMNDIQRIKKQAENNAISAAQAGDMIIYNKNIKLAEIYQNILEDFESSSCEWNKEIGGIF